MPKSRIFLARHAVAKNDQLVEPLATQQIEQLKVELVQQHFGRNAVVRYSPTNRAHQTAKRVAEPFMVKLVEEPILGQSDGGVLPWAIRIQQQANGDELWAAHEFSIVPLLQLAGIQRPQVEDTPFGCLYLVDFDNNLAERLI